MSTVIKIFLAFVAVVIGGASFMVYRIRHQDPLAITLPCEKPTESTSLVISGTTANMQPGSEIL